MQVPMKSLRMLVSLIKGPDNRGDMNYEKEGDAYRELVTLLKDKSAHFTEMIDKQVRKWHEKKVWGKYSERDLEFNSSVIQNTQLSNVLFCLTFTKED